MLAEPGFSYRARQIPAFFEMAGYFNNMNLGNPKA
jgi:hypothetical protein